MTEEEEEEQPISEKEQYFKLKRILLEPKVKKQERIESTRLTRANKTRSFNKSFSGRFSKVFKTGYQALATRGGVTRLLYKKKPIQSRGKVVKLANGQYVLVKNSRISGGYNKISRGNSLGRPGRPRGTYNSIYAQYGGVYGYRKAMALERFRQRQQILQNSVANPRQQAILRQIQSREQYSQSNPEGHVIPSTNGDVYLGGIMKEIDDASNLVG